MVHGRGNLAQNGKELRRFASNSEMTNSNVYFKLKMLLFGNMDMLDCYQCECVLWSAVQGMDLVTRAVANNVIMGMVEK